MVLTTRIRIRIRICACVHTGAATFRDVQEVQPRLRGQTAGGGVISISLFRSLLLVCRCAGTCRVDGVWLAYRACAVRTQKR